MRNTVKVVVLLLVIGFRVQAGDTAGELVSLSFKKGSLESVLKEIRRQTGYLYALQDQWKGKARPIDISVSKVPLGEALAIVFEEQPFTYAIVGKTIVVKEKQSVLGEDGSINAPSETKVHGTVYSEAGEPLAGVNVTIKEIGKGTITNEKGEFQLSSAPVGATLVISFVGYAPQQVKVKDATAVKIYLKTASDELDKAVVQAYGITTRRFATGNIGTVSAAQIARQPVMNPIQALQGEIPGVIVTNTSAYATGAVKIEIRGRNTIDPNFPSDPLYIVDGVPLTILDLTGSSSYAGGSQGVIQSNIQAPANGQSPFFSLNPADIESIEVLKDADATAIYGSRASNGVILITTKKGKAGKTKMEINVYDGADDAPRYYKMLNTSEYLAMRREALNNDGYSANTFTAPDLVVWDTTRNTDWQRYLWGNPGRQTVAQASLSGGDARTTFRFGAGYLNQTEIITRNGANQRGSLDFNINHKSVDQRLGISFTGNYSIASTDQINNPGAITLPPDAPPVFDKLGRLNYAGWSPLNFIFGAFATFLQPYKATSNFLTGNMVISYEPLKGLVVRANLGYNNFITNQSLLTPIASKDPTLNPTGSSAFGTTMLHNVIAEPQVEYNAILGMGKLGILAGGSIQTSETTTQNLSGVGYTNDALLTSVNSAPFVGASNGGAQYKYDAVFGRISYLWNSKIIVNLNARRDGSTRFGPGRQFGNFGSVGMAYIFTEENWFKNHLSVLSFGKIRGSYGTVGGDQIGNFAYLSLWTYGRGFYNNYLPLTPMRHTDSTLHWQVNKKAELALDLSFLKDRINFEISWYEDRCNDQLVSFPTPAFTGFTSVTSNSPADVENYGWELMLNAKLIETKSLSLSTKFNIGINKNKLIAYPNLALSPYAGSYFIGQSLNVRRLLHYTGIDPQTGEYAFADKNHDGQITYDFSGKTSDDSYFKDLSPLFDGSFTTNLSYKNWELNLFFYFKEQIGGNVYTTLDAPGDETNQPKSVLNHWRNPGDNAPNPRFTTQPPADLFYFQGLSNASFTDASFIRLQNLALSYNIDKNLAKKAGMSSFKVFVQGSNLWVLTKYQGTDPELSYFSSPPRPRTVVAGISCTF